MGGSEALCEIARIVDTRSQIHLQCAAGVISTTAIAENTGKPIFEAGVIPQSADSFSSCSATAFTDAAKCSSFLDTAALTAKIIKECEGQKSCSVADLTSYMPKSEAPAVVTAAQLKDAGKSLTMNKEECLGELSSIFVQAGCILPPKEVEERRIEGLLIACVAVFIALFIINYFDFIRKN